MPKEMAGRSIFLKSDSDGDPDDLSDDNDDEESQGDTASIHPVGHSFAEMDNALRDLVALHVGQPPR